MTGDLQTESIDGLGEFVIYTTDDGKTELHLRVIDDTVWMTQAQIADLFGVTRANIGAHLKNIYVDGELTRDRTSKKFLSVRSEGDRNIRRTVSHYNLDAILAIGYRVRGPRGSQFRTWATSVLREYLIKGFAMDDERLKDPRGRDYFDELLARIRDIRSSEARMYQKVRDIFALADDYSSKDPRSSLLFQKIQNKLHYAITGQTATEIIATRCDPTADNLGLVTFSGSRVLKRDVTNAKNYLTQDELEMLNLLVSQFLDYAESQAKRRRVVHMTDWLEKTDKFIEFNEYEALTDAGRISRPQADELAHERYAIYDARRKAPQIEAFDTEILDTLQEIDRRIVADRARLAPRKIDPQQRP